MLFFWERDISLAIKYYTTLSADQGYEDAIKFLAYVLIDETKKESKYLFQAIYRTKNALKIIKESDGFFTKFKDFLEWCKSYCGGCGAENKSNLLTCARCKVIMYCNINCQKKHWKEGGHKPECKEIV